MAEYIDREKIEKKARYRKELGFPCVDIIDIHETPTADVIERSEYEKLRLVNLDLAEINKGLLAEHAQLEKLRSKINKAIEEIEDYNIKTNFADCSEAFQLGVTRGLDLASEIIKRNIGELKGEK